MLSADQIISKKQNTWNEYEFYNEDKSHLLLYDEAKGEARDYILFID